MKVIIDENVPEIITAAGNPKIWTEHLKNENRKVVHVVSSVKFALKAQESGVDALVAEGFEAGGHNGREETTTMTLIPIVKKAIKIPLIAAGGIASGKSMFAAMALGADGVQVGSRFVASNEASSHLNFKNEVIRSEQGSTILTLKEITPVRMIKNPFYYKLKEIYDRGGSVDELKNMLGRGRAKKGMFVGDLVEGELEIGQVAGQIDKIISAESIIKEFIKDYNLVFDEIKKIT